MVGPRQVAPFHRSTVGPAVDLELMGLMLMVGYAFGTWSERWLCDEVHQNLT